VLLLHYFGKVRILVNPGLTPTLARQPLDTPSYQIPENTQVLTYSALIFISIQQTKWSKKEQ